VCTVTGSSSQQFLNPLGAHGYEFGMRQKASMIRAPRMPVPLGCAEYRENRMAGDGVSCFDLAPVEADEDVAVIEVFTPIKFIIRVG